jgi:hypothetical protein
VSFKAKTVLISCVFCQSLLKCRTLFDHVKVLFRPLLLTLLLQNKLCHLLHPQKTKQIDRPESFDNEIFLAESPWGVSNRSL